MAAALHILHLHSSFDLGGKEARAVRLMNLFGDRARHTIVSGVPEALGARAAIAPGIAYEIAQDPPPLTGKPSVARYEALARYMRRFDLVLSYNWGAIDGVMARRVFGKGMPPIVHHEDGFNSDEANGLKPQRNMYRRIALAAAHALVVPSATLEAIARKRWGQPAGRVHRIVNGIDVARYAIRPDERAIPGFRRKAGEVVIGTLAGLREVKDLPMLVRAAGGLSGKVRLVIVGEGPERGRIEATAAAMGMADRVHLPGFLPDPARCVGLFDILALSSRSEQFPIAVVEGMAAGLPIAAPAVGDVPTMISPENAAYIARGHGEIWLRDILQLMVDNPPFRQSLGATNRRKAAAEYDEATMLAAYQRLYGEAVGVPDILG
ncbi:MAG: glycosyl transferase family 1 [Sphingomonas sp.]|nr:glycosyl transferase family 1 [Sphingomonas sp.]